MTSLVPGRELAGLAIPLASAVWLYVWGGRSICQVAAARPRPGPQAATGARSQADGEIKPRERSGQMCERRYERPRVSECDLKPTPEVNSNTLGLCALHQPGAVCTKTAKPGN